MKDPSMKEDAGSTKAGLRVPPPMGRSEVRAGPGDARRASADRLRGPRGRPRAPERAGGAGPSTAGRAPPGGSLLGGAPQAQGGGAGH